MGDFVLNPLAFIGVGAHKHHRNGSALQLPVNPRLDPSIAPALYGFKISFIDVAVELLTPNDVAVAHVHHALYIVVLETEKNLSSHN
ncbi:hypothetical protein D3C85_1615850 [compost metagenome]